MSSTDERIKQIIARKKEQEADAEAKETNAKQAETARQKLLANRRKKWADDTHIIDAAVKEVQSKASELKVELKFQHTPGNPGTTIGVAHFSGRSPKTLNGEMVWNVNEDGAINVYHGRRATQAKGKSFSLEDADKAMYEKHILDFVDLIV